jgi:uncharacterized protein (TIGR03435 family)
MSDLAWMLEDILQTPVIDETGLDGRYDIEVPGPDGSVDDFLTALKERAGLELTREKREIKMVVVRNS